MNNNLKYLVDQIKTPQPKSSKSINFLPKKQPDQK